MYRNIIILSLIALLTLTLGGCGKSPTGSGGDNGFPASAYPNEIGMYWKYAVQDHLTGTTDTISASIISSQTILTPEITTQTWHYYWHSSCVLFDKHVILTNDSLQIYSIDDEPFFEQLIRFPLDDNSGWSGPMSTHGSVDTSHATHVTSLTTPAGQFSSAIQIERNWHQDFEGGYKQSYTWLVPEVGLAKYQLLVVYSDGAHLDTTINQTWELAAYNLNTFTVEEFPNSPGHIWTYEIQDTTESTIDNVTVSITGTIFMTELETNASIWVYEYNDRVDTQYVVSSDHRVSFYSSLDASAEEYGFTFPMALGRFWCIFTFAPVSDLTEKGLVAVPAGSFNNGFRYANYGGMFNYYYWFDSWLVPGIGIVKSTRHIANLGPYETEIWVLVEHAVTTITD
ncbi:MAG: hypothetical protein KAR42_03630 [candidate division Zixibacteria bacterium]|nr:hypothetical protein [candidate division Zixibacteria bacterium]